MTLMHWRLIRAYGLLGEVFLERYESAHVEYCLQRCHNVQRETQSGPSVLTLLPRPLSPHWKSSNILATRPKVHNSTLKVKLLYVYMASLFTVSKACVKSMNILCRSILYSWHFSWICLTINILYIVDLLGLNPIW
jgi:hypothetical protein